MSIKSLQTLRHHNTISYYGMNRFVNGLNHSEIPQVQSISRPDLKQSLRKYLGLCILIAVDYHGSLLALQSAVLTEAFLTSQPFAGKFFLGHISPNFFWVIPLFFMGVICYERLYQRRMPFWENAAKLIKACTFATLCIIGSLFLIGISELLSRLFIGFIWLYSCLFLIGIRYLTQRMLVATGLWHHSVVIIGNQDGIAVIKESFAAEPNTGYQIADIIEYAPDPRNSKEFPSVEKLENWKQKIIDSGVSEVIITLPEVKRPDLLTLIYWAQPFVKYVTIMPDLLGMPLSNLETDFYFDQQTVMLRVCNNLLIYRNRLIKRIFDLGLGTLFFMFALPVMVLIAVWIKLDSPGPVVHAGKRLGKDGRNFKCYKFRTMYVNERKILREYLASQPKAAKEWLEYAKLRGFDPRVTGVGKWLRKFSLDELPQIVNVLKGDMSLVGPRPYLPNEQQRMKFYKKTILETVPGITGLWQVRGRNDITFEERLVLESWYVRNWSVWLDITLLIRTVGTVIGKRGAY